MTDADWYWLILLTLGLIIAVLAVRAAREDRRRDEADRQQGTSGD